MRFHRGERRARLVRVGERHARARRSPGRARGPCRRSARRRRARAAAIAVANRVAPVDARPRAARARRADLGDDRQRILAARVVAGEHDDGRRGARPPRPSAGACRGRGRRRSRTRRPAARPRARDVAQAPQALVERVRAVRVVDDDERRPSPPSRCMPPGPAARARSAARTAASSGRPAASSTPSTPSTFATLKRPTSAVATVGARRGSSRGVNFAPALESAMSCASSQCSRPLAARRARRTTL